MEKKTLEALKQSITNYKIRKAHTLSLTLPVADLSQQKPPGLSWYGRSSCPLCGLFNHCGDGAITTRYCVGCPVAGKTGEAFCDGSPYLDYYRFVDDPCYLDTEHDRGVLVSLIDAEIEFLESLVPAENKESKE